jgi:hypothetical protein
MKIYVDIDNTICRTIGNDYANAIPYPKNIEKINKLYEQGHTIIYWTARGCRSGIDHSELTTNQLLKWRCRFDSIIVGTKPDYDLLICDKTRRLEEL